MPQTTQSMLRRLAERSMEILARHASQSAAISSFQQSLGTSATNYVAAFDAAQTASATRAGAVDGRDDALESLGDAMRVWLPQLRRDVQGVSSQGFAAGRKVAEDLLADVQAIYGLMAAQAQDDGEALSYAEALRADVDAAVVAVRKDVEATGVSADELAALQHKTRELAESFGDDLRAFRATLRVVLGKKHPAYQALRVRARRASEGRDDQLGQGQIADESGATGDVVGSPTLAQGGIADEPVEIGDEDAEASGLAEVPEVSAVG